MITFLSLFLNYELLAKSDFSSIVIKSCYDGDTCTAIDGEKIRLACIDTPELEGKNSDLEQVGSGAERWQSAIRKMKYGNRAKPHRLLEEMLIDYRHNDKLNWLDAHKFKLR